MEDGLGSTVVTDNGLSEAEHGYGETVVDNSSAVKSKKAGSDDEFEGSRRESRRLFSKPLASEMLKKPERLAAIEEDENRLERLDPEYAERRALSRSLSRPDVTLEELAAAQRKYGPINEEQDWDDCSES